MIRARRIKLGEERRTGGRETSREPTAWAGYCNGAGGEEGTGGSPAANRPAEGIQGRPLCLVASLLESQAVFTRQLEALLANLISKRQHFIIILAFLGLHQRLRVS